MISFNAQCISIVKRKANSTIEQQKCKGREKRDRPLISKIEINYQDSSEKEVLPIDPVFSNRIIFNNKFCIRSCSPYSKSFEAFLSPKFKC